ncbi:DUF6644 family protein [Phenylobacterium sp. SCN 70-31]|uniref:DUF6644 family protein n=1 Tax=Phenylobacterium sp. SCN 70-31 TaxID=1660129 RepID=UPI0008691E85|nr:DUF6644 family protein [Phenylobacterium sp. SCN 70-31]ODT85583.1 MAG: hypothetical protein ABS78_19695 [Phenylobacterium sp. SCN 70-31]
MIAPQDFLPQIADWVANLDDVFPGSWVKPYFAQWEVVHLLSLALIGGTTLLLNLRLIGFGLNDEPPSAVRRAVLPWLNLGVAGILVTGVLIGTSNPERLYTSEAFTAKMLGLAAALILTYGVSLPAARAEGRLSRGAGLWAALGLAVFGVSLSVFAVANLVNPGLWHLVIAAALLVLFVTRGRMRIAYLLGLLGLMTTQVAIHHVIYRPDDYANLDPANKAMIGMYLAWILAAAAIQIVRDGSASGRSVAVKALAYAGILVWVVTAAAGRWIAFA